MSSDYTSRAFPKHQSMRPIHVHDAKSEIRKYIPRQPKRINEISQRFSTKEQEKMASYGLKTVQAPRKKLGPIDVAGLDPKNGANQAASPRQNANVPTQVGDSKFLGKFGFNGDKNSAGMLGDNKNRQPQYDSKEDEELGIDRSLMDPIKFVSAIDSKPIFPPYLQLADFESYLTQEAGRLTNIREKKGENNEEAEDKAAESNKMQATKKDTDSASFDPAKLEVEISEMMNDKVYKLYYDHVERVMTNQ